MAPLSLLIIEENDVLRSLIARALMRRFGAALVQQCSEVDAAIFGAQAPALTAIVAGGVRGASHPRLLTQLREANSEVPIVALSSELAHAAASGAGASCLLDPQTWIRVPDIVETIVRLKLRHGDTVEVEMLRAV